VRNPFIFAALFVAVMLVEAQEPQPVALTIYNRNFAVARSFLDLGLHEGINEITIDDVTSRLEPDSVVLRDPTGKRIVHGSLHLVATTQFRVLGS
jgi:hypothetical protein